MQNDIDLIVSNALKVDKSNFAKEVKVLLEQFKNALNNSKDLLYEAVDIDKKNNNGFTLDFDIINRIIANVSLESLMYGKVTFLQKDDAKKLFYGKQIMDAGLVSIITDGNPYVNIELICKNIMVGNTIILVNNGFMYGTNNFIVTILQSVLEVNGLSKNFIQMYVSDNYNELFNNYANIDLIVCAGNHNLQNIVAEGSRVRTVLSGYENFDLYVESKTNLDFIDKIIDTGLSIKVYADESLMSDYNADIFTNDIDEAIALINYNGSRYSTAIFTDNSDNAAKFIRKVKSRQVVVNASPTIERICDIKQEDLCLEKTIIYPMGFKFDGSYEEINIV